MTSSLVGSEMCIRDRVPGDRSRRSRSQRQETDDGKVVVGGFRQWVEVRSDHPRHTSRCQGARATT
eukprot:6772622-Prorocentrum_lima.AAC.1